MEDEKTDIMHPLSPEPKTPLGKIRTPETEEKSEKEISIPDIPAGESDDYKKGFREGYKKGYKKGKSEA